MIIAQGAEAVLLKKSNRITKHRTPKHYRITSLDESLRKSRTKREIKIIGALQKSIDVPKILSRDKYLFEMEYLDGPKIRDVLDNKPILAKKIGIIVARLHNVGIIHGDITTSNMILHKNKIFLIDFGLSSFSKKVEDKAVDIHLFKQALESKHHRVYEKALKLFLEGYKAVQGYRAIIKQLEKVEARGRYKQKK